MIILKSKDEIEAIRRSCGIVAEILARLKDKVVVGVSTKDLEDYVERFLKSHNVQPAFKGYRGYPACICTSVNDVVVHGIPSANQVLREGDIVSIDLGVYFEGFYGDAARTYSVGQITPIADKLLSATEKALYCGIEAARDGSHLQDISWAIQDAAEGMGFSVVRDFVGHGIGRDLHEDPPVPNFGRAGMGPRLQVGMVLAIEPMINEGTPDVVVDEDGWTARTKDGTLSAHFEHSVAITSNGPRILSGLD